MAILNCFAELKKQGYKSITLPTIGAGQLGYPGGLVAKTMTESITGHFLNNLNDCLEVVICVYEKDIKTTQVFTVVSHLTSFKSVLILDLLL